MTSQGLQLEQHGACGGGDKVGTGWAHWVTPTDLPETKAQEEVMR